MGIFAEEPWSHSFFFSWLSYFSVLGASIQLLKMVKRKRSGKKQGANKKAKVENQVRLFSLRISLEKDQKEFEVNVLKAMRDWVADIFKHYICQVEDSFLEKNDDEKEMLEMDGVTHNIHLQAFARSDEKVRASTIRKALIKKFPGKSVHVAPASAAGVRALKKYCMKVETRVLGPWADKEQYMGADLIKKDEMVGFQKWICKLLPTKPSRRLTYWFYCPEGGSGKSAIGKYLAYHHDVPMFTFAKAWDLLKLVSMEPNRKMYIINLSKTKPAEVSMDDMYNVLESIKDRNFCSYKGTDVKRVLMNPPHLIVFANCAPKKEAMTQKRLKTFKIPPLPIHLLEDAGEEPEMEAGMEIFVQEVLVTGDNVEVSGIMPHVRK